MSATSDKRATRRRAIAFRGDARRMRRYFYIGIMELRDAGTSIDLRSFRLAMRACRIEARAALKGEKAKA